ncbi:MAG TPA: hypothetical protein VH396_11625 [Chitinophagaceae bacterium]
MPQKSNNSLSPLTWIIISGVGFVVFLIAALLFSLYSDKINFISQSAYFFLLVPLALVAAGFLFGALRSHAKYSGKAYGGTLELSGPIVVLALIIYLGYKFRPVERSFSFTVNVFSGNDSSEAIRTGYTELFFGTAHQTKNISEGQSVFSEVPYDYKGKSITLIAHAEGYKTKKSDLIIPYESIPVNLYLQKVPDSVTVTGLVKDRNGIPVKDAVLIFADGLLKTTSDHYGNFRVSLPYKDGEQIALRVYTADKLRYDNLITLSEKVSLTIPLR